MTKLTDKQVDSIATAIAVSFPITIAVVVIGLWILQANDNNARKQLAKHETCYQEYRLDDRTGETYLIVDYCGGMQEGIERK